LARSAIRHEADAGETDFGQFDFNGGFAVLI
jgi:hypothetical protein